MNIRKRFFHNNYSAFWQLCCGAVLFLFFMLNSSLWVRTVQLGILGFLARSNGKRIRWWYFIILIFSVTLAHQLTPFGRVLFQWRWVVITEGSLRLGMEKGMFFSGFTFVSLFSVRRELKIPGVAGKIISLVLHSYEVLVSRTKPKLAASSIHSFIRQSYQEVREVSVKESPGHTSAMGWVTSILLILLFALLYGSGRL